MMEKEINNVLDGAGKTPDATKENQLLQSIQKLISDAETRAKLAAHPIGSLYWSSDSTDPGTLFGGTWARIKDKFILAAGDTYSNGDTGGAATVTLTTNNMPSHSHTIGGNTGETQPTFTGSAVTSGGSSTDNTGSESAHTHSVGAHSHPIGGNTGGGYAQLGSAASPSSVTTSFSTASGGTHRHRLFGANSGNTMEGRYWAISTYGLVGYSSGGAYADKTINDTKTLIEDGGSHSHTIYQSTHSHTLPANTSNSTAFTSGTGSAHSHSMKHTHSVTASGTVSKHTHTLPANTGSSGSGTAVDIMPPYLVKYCWERTA